MPDNSEEIKKLDRLTLREAFFEFILDDPVIEAFGKAAATTDDACQSIFENSKLIEYNRGVWPARYEQYDVTNSLAHFLSLVAKLPLPDSFKEVSSAFRERYVFFVDLLRRGQIEAWGMPPNGERSVRIPPGFFSDEKVFFDFVNCKVDMWRGVGLQLPAAVQAGAGDNPTSQVSSADSVREKSRGGRPSKHLWKSAFSYLVVKLVTEGLPETGAELSRMMLECLEDRADKECPEEKDYNPPEEKDVGKWLKEHQRPLWDKVVTGG